MKLSQLQLRGVIREYLLIEEKKDDIDFDPSELGSLNVPPKLLKMLDPDIPPAKYAAMDAELDASGTVNQQAFAMAAFALSYADGVSDDAANVLKKAIQLIPKIIAARESPDEGEDESFEIE